MRRLACSLLMLGAFGCGGDSSPPGKTSDGDAGTEQDGAPPALPQKLALTADWLNGTVSYVDVDKLLDPKAKDVVTSRADLSKYVPGPLEIELTSDKKRAVITASAGFFSVPGAGIILGNDPIPQGDGKVLVLNVETQRVEAELVTGKAPTGIAITPDGKRAFVAHFGSGDVAIVDVPNGKVLETVPVGSFAEEIAVDDTGSVGVLGYSTDGSVRTFGVSDFKNTLSDQVALKGDSAGMAFFPGTKIALVMQAANVILTNASGYTLIDVQDPQKPKVLEDVRKNDGVVLYPAVAAPGRGTILAPVTENGRLVLREYALATDHVELKQSIDVAPGAQYLTALGVGFDGDHHAAMALPGMHALAVTDLDTGKSHVVPWDQPKYGPADVTFR